MITKYKQFCEQKINEGLWDSMKGLFNSLMSNLSDEFKKPIDELTNKLNSTKGDNQKIKNIYKEYVNESKKTFIEDVNKTEISGMKNLIKSNITAIYTTVNQVIKFSNDPNITLQTVFGKLPTQSAKQLTLDSKKFEKTIDEYTKGLVKFLNIKAKFNEEELKLNENFIFEAGETETSNPADEKSKIENAVEGDNKATDNKEGEAKPDNKPDPKLIQFRKDVINWFNTNIYTPVYNNTINVKKGNSVVIPDTSITSTTNKTGVKNLVNKVLAVQPDGKTNKKLGIVRDALIKNGFGKKDDFGTF
jgi:sugar-specific transcriptional regulator TrmB